MLRASISGLLLAALTALPALADPTLDRDIAGAAGGRSVGGGLTLGFTVGESIVGVSLAPGGPPDRLSAGFWRSPIAPTSDADDIDDTDATVPWSGLSLTVAPNPFTVATEIHFVLPPKAGLSTTRVRLFDSSGRLVREVALSEDAVGPQSVTWDGRDRAGRVAPRGIYHCRIDAGRFTSTRSITRIY